MSRDKKELRTLPLIGENVILSRGMFQKADRTARVGSEPPPQDPR
jgi:hypothetical protein